MKKRISRKKNKYRLKKHQIFKKCDEFENRPSCKGYSLCKMISLGQKLKMPKSCTEQFYNKSCSVQKTASKNTKYSRNATSLKIGHYAKAIAHAKAIYSLCKMISLGHKLKTPKTCAKQFYNSIIVILCKKPLQKTRNIQEMRRV